MRWFAMNMIHRVGWLVGVLGVSTVVVAGPVAAVTPARGGVVAQAAPVVTSLSPDHGPMTGHTWVTVNGSGFAPEPAVTSVTVDGQKAEILHGGAGVGGVTFTWFKFITPAHTPDAVAVVVTTPGGSS